METHRWYILNREGGRVKPPKQRPKDANPLEGDENTPWYKVYSHIHYDDRGYISGVHYFGTYQNALSYLKYALESE